MRKCLWFALACVLAGCGIPVGLGVATFMSAAAIGAGAAVGAGAVDVGWEHLPPIPGIPAATPTPAKVAAENPKWLPAD